MLKELRFDRVTLVALYLGVSALAACVGLPSPTAQPTAPVPSSPTPPTELSVMLPAPVYFLREGQVWRLRRDAGSQEQISHEATPITDLDVSPVDGALVYVSDNHLIHTDADGQNRQVLVAGPTLPPVGDDLVALNDEGYIAGRIAAPRWAPDGDRIAYVQNGLNLISASSLEVQAVRPNGPLPEPGETWYEGPLLFSSLFAWSPDGSYLLAEVYRYPLASVYDRMLGITDLSDASVTMFHCVPCHFAWTADGQVFYTANPYVGRPESLARYDMVGGQNRLIGQYVPARTAYFYAYPHAPNLDEVYVFMATAPDTGEVPEAFKMYKMGADGYGITALRTDEYAIQTALWAGDSSGALIVTSTVSGGIPAHTLVWLAADGSPAIPLPVTGARTLRWGVEIPVQKNMDVQDVTDLLLARKNPLHPAHPLF